MNRGAPSVYRMRDANGVLLYVGCTAQGAPRLDHHRYTQPWWKRVAIVEVEHFDDIESALAAEVKAIQTENPEKNRTSRYDFATLRRHANSQPQEDS